uniref:S-acyltransferase n=1 Tax=Rhizophora mucronata TaxID=61149 RepID=A0A2P2K2B6_RHIMU
MAPLCTEVALIVSLLLLS